MYQSLIINNKLAINGVHWIYNIWLMAVKLQQRITLWYKTPTVERFFLLWSNNTTLSAFTKSAYIVPLYNKQIQMMHHGICSQMMHHGICIQMLLYGICLFFSCLPCFFFTFMRGSFLFATAASWWLSCEGRLLLFRALIIMMPLCEIDMQHDYTTCAHCNQKISVT